MAPFASELLLELLGVCRRSSPAPAHFSLILFDIDVVFVLVFLVASLVVATSVHLLSFQYHNQSNDRS